MLSSLAQLQIAPTVRAPPNLRDEQRFPSSSDRKLLYKPFTRLLLQVSHVFAAPRTAFQAHDFSGTDCMVNLRLERTARAERLVQAIQNGKVLALRRPDIIPSVPWPNDEIVSEPPEVIVYREIDIQVFPCSLGHLLEISDALQDLFHILPFELAQGCWACGTTANKMCERCLAYYKEGFELVEPVRASVRMLMQWGQPH